MDQLSPIPLFSQGALEAQVEAWIVDADDGLWLQREDFFPHGEELPGDFRKARDDVDKTHHLEALHLEMGFDRKGSHPGARHGADLDSGALLQQLFNEFRSLEIGARLSGEEEKISHFFYLNRKRSTRLLL